MAQADQTIQNATFPAVRADINDNLAALFSQSSGSSEPATTVAFQPWVDTSSSPPVWKVRNGANNGWITIGLLDSAFSIGGVTAIANGGTGASTAAAALTALLPSQSGNSGRILATDGTAASWKYGSLFYRLNANVVGANSAIAQSVFGVGVTLAAGTVYAFDGLYLLSKTAGTTSHSIGLGFGGTATINNIAHSGLVSVRVVAFPFFDAAPEAYSSTQAGNSQVCAADSSATISAAILLRGTVSINAAGTFIPQYTLSAAPGGAYTTLAGSWISFAPIGAAGSNSSEGAWS